MRDPKRINSLLKTLNRIWKRSPDLRFFQLISAFESYMAAKYKIMDLFYMEDDWLEEYLVEFEEQWLGKE